MPETTTGDCQHQVKWRLLYGNPRLFRCGGSTTIDVSDPGCGALFVEGREWLGEPKWIPTGHRHHTDVKCDNCLDGFCTSLDHHTCQLCGRGTARPVAVAYQEEIRQDSILRGGMPDADEVNA